MTFLSKRQLLLSLCVTSLSITTSIFALSPQEIEQAYTKSYAQEKAGNFKESLNSLAPVAKDYPAGYTVNYRMGYLNLASKNYPSAIECYDRAIKAVPTAVEPKLAKMYTLMMQEKYSDAEQIGYQILNLDFTNYLANLRLVYSLRMQKKFDLAEKITLKMLAIYPIDTGHLTELGILKYAAGSFQKVESIFQDVLLLDPGNAVAKDYIALSKKMQTTTPAQTSTDTTKK